MALLPSWQLVLPAGRKAPTPSAPTCEAPANYLTWSKTEFNEQPFHQARPAALDHLHPGLRCPTSSARIRRSGRAPLAVWLADEKEIDENPFLGLKPRKIDTKVVERLADAELRLMFKPAPVTRPSRRSNHSKHNIFDIWPGRRISQSNNSYQGCEARGY